MITLKSEMKTNTVEHLRGGEGCAHLKPLLTEMPKNVKLFNTITLDPGSSIAYHVHENYSDIDAHLKVGEGPLDWQKFFQDFKQYTPDARLVLEYLHGPVSEIVDTIGVIKGYLGE